MKKHVLTLALLAIVGMGSAQASVVTLGDNIDTGNCGSLGYGVAIGTDITVDCGPLGNASANFLLIGSGSVRTNGTGIGNNVNAGRGVAIGERASNTNPLQNAGELYQISIGYNSSTNNDKSVAINSTVQGREAVGINGNTNGDFGIAINGNTNGKNSVVVGGNNVGTNNTLTGAWSRSNGYGNTLSGAGAQVGRTGIGGRYIEYGTAGGYRSTVDANNSASYGAFSSTNGRSNVFSVGNSQSVADDMVVGPGSGPIRRQIINVAAGTEGNDAVIVDQIAPIVGSLGGGANITNGVYTGPTYNLSTGTYNNVGDALTALDNKPGGGGTPNPYFQANGLNDGSDNAFAVGPRSVAAGPNSTAMAQSDTAVGDEAYADGAAHCAGGIAQATAVGAYATAEGCGSTAQGSSANATGPFATATGRTASATGASASAYGNGATAIGPYSTAVGAVALAAGASASAYGNGAQAQGQYATSIGGASWAAPNSTALGAFAGAPNANAVAIGYNTQTTRDGEVAFGNRLLGQVANGIMDTDAVNVRQLSQVAQYFGGGTALNGGIWTPPTFALPSGPSFDNVNDALVYLDGRINDLDTGPGSPGPQGPQGPRGADGRSAYEVAVEEGGFVGTEQEWLESLQGADGQDGAPGRDGVGGSKVKGGSNIAVTDNEDGTQTVSVTDQVKLSDQGSVEVGATRVDAQGVTIQGGPSMTRNGVDAGSKRVTNVAPGRIASDSWDAVNGSQLWEMNDRWEHRIDGLDKRISGVCAMGAAQAQAIGAAAANSARRKVSAGIGYCGGQAAMSANMSWDAIMPSGSVASFSIGVSSTGDDTSIAAGMSVGW